MKAITCTHYGPPEFLELSKLAKPALRDDEILIIFDTVGKSSLADCLRSLKKEGSYLQAVAGPAQLLQMRKTSCKERTGEHGRTE